MRELSIINRHPRLRLNKRAIARMVAVLDAHQAAIVRGQGSVPAGELSLVFLTDPALAQLHVTFLSDPSTTDVMTFAGDSSSGTVGEICVSADTASSYVRACGGNLSRELTLYIVHGWLHLAGHDDLAPAKKRAMRRAETRAMRVLENAGAVPHFALTRGRTAGRAGVAKSRRIMRSPSKPTKPPSHR